MLGWVSEVRLKGNAVGKKKAIVYYFSIKIFIRNVAGVANADLYAVV